MWHEARRQERKIRGMLVDYRKRAERRRDFYEKIVSLFISIQKHVNLTSGNHRKQILHNFCKFMDDNAKSIWIQL